MKFDERLHEQIRQHPFPLLFTTISGAHLYRFPSADSDYDMRGVHVVPIEDVIGSRTTWYFRERQSKDSKLLTSAILNRLAEQSQFNRASVLGSTEPDSFE